MYDKILQHRGKDTVAHSLRTAAIPNYKQPTI